MFYPKQIYSSILRLWLLIVSTQASIIILTYIFAGKGAFFLLGPFFLYNLIIYTFPYWYPPLITTSLYKGVEFQKSLQILKHSFKKLKRMRPELLMMNTEFNNLLVFSHRKRLWVITDKKFMDSLGEDEQKLIFDELALLQARGRLATATVYSALHFTLPFLPVRKGTELGFFSENEQENWLYLNYKTFHRLSLKSQVTQSHLLPCLFFPALPNYNPESYFSLYTFLRERLIKSMQPSVDMNADANTAMPAQQGEL
jgi:hypothetical protein